MTPVAFRKFAFAIEGAGEDTEVGVVVFRYVGAFGRDRMLIGPAHRIPEQLPDARFEAPLGAKLGLTAPAAETLGNFSENIGGPEVRLMKV